MKKRQLKKNKGKQPQKPTLQEAWDVVAQELANTVRPGQALCMFVMQEYSSKQVRMYNTLGYELRSTPGGIK